MDSPTRAENQALIVSIGGLPPNSGPITLRVSTISLACVYSSALLRRRYEPQDRMRYERLAPLFASFRSTIVIAIRLAAHFTD